MNSDYMMLWMINENAFDPYVLLFCVGLVAVAGVVGLICEAVASWKKGRK